MAKFKGQRGYVYVLLIDDTWYKIGASRNIRQRIENLVFGGKCLGYEPKIELVVSWPTDDMYKEEMFVHRWMADKNIKYELFRLEEEDVMQLKRHASRHIGCTEDGF